MMALDTVDLLGILYFLFYSLLFIILFVILLFYLFFALFLYVFCVFFKKVMLTLCNSIKKGATIEEFLELVRHEFKELRGVSPEHMLFVKEDLIIPHVCISFLLFL